MRPRILFAAPRLPYPLDTGANQRRFHILKALAGLGDVQLVAYSRNGAHEAATDLEPLRQLCSAVHLLPEPGVGGEQPRNSWDFLHRALFSPRPLHITAFPGGPLAARVADLASHADLLWVAQLEASEWIRAARDRMIVDINDLESVKEEQRLAVRPARFRPWDLLARFDNGRLGRLERTAPARYGSVAVCSEEDRRFFPPRLAHRVLVVPNGVSAHLLARPRNEAADPAPSIVFVGTVQYAPNRDAAGWFTREIFPIVAAAVPAVRLYLVGDDPRGRLRSLHDGRRVIVTGRVADVAPYVSRAALSVVPIRWGGGTRIKILESLALGTPVVSTTVGAHGLDLVPGQHIELADTPGVFAEAVVTLLKDSGARARMSAAGRALVATRYTWEQIGRRLVDDLEGWRRARPPLSPPAGPSGRGAESPARERT